MDKLSQTNSFQDMFCDSSTFSPSSKSEEVMSLQCNHSVPRQMILLVIISVATSRLSLSVPSFAINHATISELIVFMEILLERLLEGCNEAELGVCDTGLEQYS
jgi:hypothetical protein